MNPFEMVLGIVLIVTIGTVLKARFRHRESGGDDAAEAEMAALRRRVDQLHERVQVLEKLAIDPAKRLADEIDSLRG